MNYIIWGFIIMILAISLLICMFCICAFINEEDDPVKYCEVFNSEGCSYVDGPYCCPGCCDILKKFREQKNI